MIRGIIFDCFGVLYAPATVAYFSRFPAQYDELHDLNKRADYGFIDRAEYVREVSRLTGEDASVVLEAFAKEYLPNQELFDYIRESLKPHFKIGLLSNIGRHWMQDFFDENQLHDLFDSVVLSGEEGMIKPNPHIFELAAARLELPVGACFMIDDREENCRGAQDAGMIAHEFRSNKALKSVLATLQQQNG